MVTIISNARDFAAILVQHDIEKMVKREVGTLKRPGSSVERWIPPGTGIIAATSVGG